MNPALYDALQQNIQALDTAVTCMTIPEGTNPTTMKNRILRIAAELGMHVTIRKILGGLHFWRSSEEDQQQAHESADRLQPSRQRGKTAPQRPSRKRTTPRR